MDVDKIYKDFDWEFENFLWERNVNNQKIPSKKTLRLAEKIFRIRIFELGEYGAKYVEYDFFRTKEDVCVYVLMKQLVDGILRDTPLDSDWNSLIKANNKFHYYIRAMVDERSEELRNHIDEYELEYNKSKRNIKIDELLK